MALPTRIQNITLWLVRILLALAFGAAGAAKLAGVPQMVELFDHIGVGQWFRMVTGAVELGGALLLLLRPTVFYASAVLCITMLVGVGMHLFVVGGSPVPAAVLCLLSGFAAWRTLPIGARHPMPNLSHR
jgi:uncharacterized membrane protein YphA (DoxX/SURF4 family)